MYHILVHSPVAGHVGCFYVLAIVSSAAVNVGVRVSFWIMVLPGYVPSNGIAGSYGSSSQSILKEISPGCSLEGMMLKLKLQYFGNLMWRVDSLGKTLMLGGIGGRRRRGRQRMRWLDASLTRWTWVWVNSGSWWWTGRPGVLRFMGLQRVGHDWATELNLTER